MPIRESGAIDLDGSEIRITARWDQAPTCRHLPGAYWEQPYWRLPATPENAYACRISLRLPESEEFSWLAAAGSTPQTEWPEDVPPTASSQPWPHQCQGFWSAHDKNAWYLAHGMGCGKTYTSKMLLDYWQAATVLVVSPKKIIEQKVWERDFAKHGGRYYRFLLLDHGSSARSAAALRNTAERPLIVCVNYDAFWRGDLGKLLLSMRWDAVVYDEAHRLKSVSGRASKFAAQMRGAASRVIALSGTPFPNGPADIYAQVRALDQSIYGKSYVGFKAQYIVMDKTNMFPAGHKNLPDLQRKFFSVSHQVDRRLLKLPDMTVNWAEFKLEPATMKAYRDIKRDFIAEIEQGIVTTKNILTKCITLQRITSGYAQTEDGTLHMIDGSRQKMLEDLLADIDRAEPVIVFCRFHVDLDAVHAAAKASGRVSSELSGRVNTMDQWSDVIAVQIAAGREGIDLTKAAYVIYYSLGYSLGEYEQSLARAHRPGQSRPVSVYHVVASGTIDENIYEALTEKREIANTLLAIADEEVHSGHEDTEGHCVAGPAQESV